MTDDYIKREDAIETVYHIRKKPADDEWAKKWLTPLQDIPSADVVEVVRCKDCKRYNTDDCFMIHGKKMNRNLFDDDYCSYGERADE